MNKLDRWTDRTEKLIGPKAVEKLNNCHVLVVGAGGVGGYVCEFLVRAGIGMISVMDPDTVEMTNLNRQIAATTQTLGKLKTDALGDRLKEINPALSLFKIPARFCAKNAQEILSGSYHFVVDAIDSVQDKTSLISVCRQKNIPVISAMGAGNRWKTTQFIVQDLFQTKGDGLARVMRKNLRQQGVTSLPCVCATDAAESVGGGAPGSISYMPAASACSIAAYVVRQLVET